MGDPACWLCPFMACAACFLIHPKTTHIIYVLMSHRHADRSVWGGYFPNWYPFFPNGSSPCHVDIETSQHRFQAAPLPNALLQLPASAPSHCTELLTHPQESSCFCLLHVGPIHYFVCVLVKASSVCGAFIT